MSQQSSNLEIPLRVIGPDGTTILWQGLGTLGAIVVGKASAAVAKADSLMFTLASFIFQADNLAANATFGANVMSVGQSGVTPTGLIGVALNSAATGEQVLIAGGGSVQVVKTVTATAQTVGHHVVGAASGAIGASVATQPVTPIQSLGFVLKTRGTTAQPSATDTGSDVRTGILVVVH